MKRNHLQKIKAMGKNNPRKNDERRPSRSQSFHDHLDELSGRLWKSMVFVLVSTCVFYLFVDDVLFYIIKPVGKIVFTAPGDAFLARLTLALTGGIFMAMPYLIFQAWQFISCALKENERKFVSVFMPLSALLFIIGAMFAYYVVVPIALRFLLGFSTEYMVPMITVTNYISFVSTMLLAFGVTFEMPLIMMFLTKIGVATPDFLIQKRRAAIVILLILSAVITPPDVITQILLAVPLMLLYEAGILASKMIYAGKEFSHQ